MKNILGIAALTLILSTSVADAAMYRVDFGGSIDDGTYNGYFTYDPAGLNMASDNYNDPDGLEADFELNYATTAASGSFDEITAGVGRLSFTSGILTGWEIGGNESGISAISSGGENPLDFLLASDHENTFNFGSGYVYTAATSAWSVEEVQISAVPLPAGVWVFGAGLLGLAGLKKRKAAKAARAEGLIAA
ncbi:hypothetical protein [Sneathiella sp.]|uniref:hypothetical protein n=1 Tax=Sneathiella sp. TaxID=1964365 RepID=UPI0035620874